MTFLVPIIVATTGWFLHSRLVEKAGSGAVVFVPILPIRLIYYFGAPIVIWVALNAFNERPEQGWVVVGAAVVLLAVVFHCWPGTLVFDGVGVELRRLGRVRRRMGWTEVGTAAYVPFDDKIVLKARNGRALRISFISYFSDSVFDELSKHITVHSQPVKYL